MGEGDARRQAARELGKAMNFMLEFGPQSSKRLDSVINTSHSSRFLVGSQAQPLLKAKNGGERMRW